MTTTTQQTDTGPAPSPGRPLAATPHSPPRVRLTGLLAGPIGSPVLVYPAPRLLLSLHAFASLPASRVPAPF